MKKKKNPETVRRKRFKKGFLKNFAKFTGKHLCQGLFFNKVAGLSLQRNFIKKGTLTKVFSCEFSQGFQNTIFYETLPVVASETPINV